jgi:hypothetical protein
VSNTPGASSATSMILGIGFVIRGIVAKNLWRQAASAGRLRHKPTGQINSDFPKSRQAPKSKIYRFHPNPNHRYHSARPPRQEGRIAIVTDAGLDAVDAAASGAIVVAGRVLP